MDVLKEKLKLIECPSNWGLSDVKDRKSATFIIDRLLEKNEEISEPWSHACILLTIAYLHSENSEYMKAVSSVKACEVLISESSSDLIIRYKIVFQSVCYASKAMFLSYCSIPSEVQQYYDKVIPVQSLKIADKAALCAIKANVFLEFGVSGSIMASSYAKEAIQINPLEADWHFLMGKLLGRIRHFGQDHVITPAEISHLQTAFKLNRTPRTAIYLANTCIEKSKSLVSKAYLNGGRPNQATKNEIKNLTSEAKNLIKFALDNNKNQCVHIMIRCAYGLTKLPRYDRDYALAKELLEESLKRSPVNAMAHKLSGDLCLQEEKPLYHEALKHFEAAAAKNVYSANFAIFEIQLKLSLNLDPKTFYDKMLDKFTEKNYQLLTLIHASEYYLFIRRDLYMAVHYFLKAVNLDKNFHTLTDRWVKYVQKNVNLYELIANDARYAINKQMYSNPEQLEILQKVCKEINDIKPHLMQVPVVPNKVQMYLDTYQKENNNATKSGRDNNRYAGTEGRGRGRGGRGRGRGRGRGGRGAINPQGVNNPESSEIRLSQNSKNLGRGNNRMVGSRSRSSSRNRPLPIVGEKTQDINPTCFDAIQFNRITYSGNQFDEVMENPFFVKFLELRYKKLDNSKSFKEWILKYNGSNPRGEVFTTKEEKIEKSDDKLDVLIGMINQLREEFNEIKLNDSRSCYSGQQSKKCHSLKSLQYDMVDRIRNQERYKEQGKEYKKAFAHDKQLHRNDIKCYPGFSENFHSRKSYSKQDQESGRYSPNRFLDEFSDKGKRYMCSTSRDRSLSNDSRKSNSSFKYNRGRRDYDYDRKQNYHASHYRDRNISKPHSSKGCREDKRHYRKDYEQENSSSSSSYVGSDSRSREKSEERKFYESDRDKRRYHQREMPHDLKNKYSDKKMLEKSERRKERNMKSNSYVSPYHQKESKHVSLSPKYSTGDDSEAVEIYKPKKMNSSRFVSRKLGDNDSSQSDSSEIRSNQESISEQKQQRRHKDYNKKDRTDKRYHERDSEKKKELKKHSIVHGSQTRKYIDKRNRSISPKSNKDSVYGTGKRHDQQREDRSSHYNSKRNNDDKKRDSKKISLRDALLEGEHKEQGRTLKSSQKSYLKHKSSNLKNDEELSVMAKEGATLSDHENTSLSSSEQEELKNQSANVKLSMGSSCYKKRETSDVETERKHEKPESWNDYEKTSSG